MPKRILPLTLVQKRRGILEAKSISNRPVIGIIQHALNESTGKEPSTKNMREFFENCTMNNADNFYKYGLTILEDYNGKNEKLSKTFIHLFIENTLPFITDLNKFSEELNKFSFTGKNIIMEAVTEYKICDRIARNHDMISKRFNIKKFVVENKNMGLQSLTEEICKLIDTYNLPSYAKLNIALEEGYYLFGSLYPDYNPKKSVSTIVDYFLLRENTLPKSNLDAYRRTIENSRVIPKRAKNTVSFLFENKEIADSNDVKDLINKFKKEEEKDSNKLQVMVNKIFSNKPENIIDDMPNVLGLLRTMVSISTITIQPIIGILMLIANKCIGTFTEAKESEKMVKFFKKEKEVIEKKIENTTNESKLKEYRDSLDKCIEKLESHHRDITGGLDIDDEEELEEGAAKYYSLQEFKIFKHQNLIRAAIDSSKVVELNYHRLKKQNKESGNKIKSKLHHFVTPTPEEREEMEYNKLGNKIKRGADNVKHNISRAADDALGFAGMSLLKMNFSESTDDKDALSLINDMDEMDIIFAAIEFENIEDSPTLVKQFNPVMKSVNQRIFNDNLHAYMLNTDLALEFHIATNDKVYLTKEQKELKEHTMSPRDMFYISYIEYLTEEFLEYADLVIGNGDIFDRISNKINPEIEFEEACILMELYALSPKVKTKDRLSNMINYYCSESDNKDYLSHRMHQLCDNLISAKLSIQEATDMYNLALGVLDEGTSMTAAKMAMIKLKRNITMTNSNVREKMKSMEIAMSGVVRSIEKSMTTDKREAVIKGSVLPSFKKVMKLALITCAAWAINPVAGIIVAVGSFGASKALTYKEKEMILDEIEIELKVVDREIARCGESARPEKYRTLVQYQRRLERERHRIKMNMSTKGRRVPNVSYDREGNDD